MSCLSHTYVCYSCASSFSLILVTYSDFEYFPIFVHFVVVCRLRAFCSPLFPDELNTLLIAFCFAGQMCFSWVQPHEHNLFGIVRRVNERTNQTTKNNITLCELKKCVLHSDTNGTGRERNIYICIKRARSSQSRQCSVTIFVVTVTVSGAQTIHTIISIFIGTPKCKNVQLRLEEKT